MKTVSELVDRTGSTKLLLRDWISNSSNKVEVLSANEEVAKRVLCDLQVTTKSILGVVVYYTGGLLIDNGWLRILGSGNSRLTRNVTTWNNLNLNDKKTKIPNSLLIADDVLGGFFTINTGAFEGGKGEIFYLAPDTLEWEGLNMQYSDFLHWSCCGDVNQFYSDLRWKGWNEDVLKVKGDQTFSLYPFLWTKVKNNGSRTKAVVSIEETWELNLMFQKKLGTD